MERLTTPLKFTVIDCGYLGAIHAAAMASLGHHAPRIDTRPEQVETLSQGRAPFYEPGLLELLVTGVRQGDLRFTPTLTPTELAGADVHFIVVGTPWSATGGEVDLSQLWSVVDMLHDALPQGGHSLVVGKSTVPAGTAQQVAERLAGRALALWNPEFLCEGFAVTGTLHPNRIVYGVPTDPADTQETQAVFNAVYQDLLEEGIPRIITDYPTAGLVKTAVNSFLATKISFINVMAHLCDTAGAGVTVPADAIGHDLRIGRRFLQANVGFDGGRLPKDIRALRASADLHGAMHLADLLSRIDSINREQCDRIIELARTRVGGDLSGRAIIVLRAAFKPPSGDMCDSPALDVASRLADLEAEVTVYDPQALPVVARSYPHLALEDDSHAALEGVKLVLLLTEWDQFVAPDPAKVATGVAEHVITDGRNVLDPVAWCGAGWIYAGMGR